MKSLCLPHEKKNQSTNEVHGYSYPLVPFQFAGRKKSMQIVPIKYVQGWVLGQNLRANERPENKTEATEHETRHRRHG